MRFHEIISEGGWDTEVTQKTVVTPKVVKIALHKMQHFISEFNDWLQKKGFDTVKMGAPTGSSTYHDVDPEDKIYGDIDLQIVVPDLGTENKTTSQMQSEWYNLADQFVKETRPDYIHSDSEPGHPILKIADDAWVQVDMMIHPQRLEKWGRYRVTPERGVKGLLNGNMFSVLGEMLTMSIQHAGVQFKVRDRVKQPYSTTRKNYELVTLTTDIENFVLDIFKHEAEMAGIQNPKISGLLKQYPGSDVDEIKISNLAKAIKGMAESFQMNNMYGKGDLANYRNKIDFLNRFWENYESKAAKEINAKKRDKASTPEAIARAEEDKRKIMQGLDYVKAMFADENI
jgi:hypothetical protein